MKAFEAHKYRCHFNGYVGRKLRSIDGKWNYLFSYDVLVIILIMSSWQLAMYEHLSLSKWNISWKYFYISHNPCLESKAAKIISHPYLMSNVWGHYGLHVYVNGVFASLFGLSIFFVLSSIEPIHGLQYMYIYRIFFSHYFIFGILWWATLQLYPRDPNVSYCTKK